MLLTLSSQPDLPPARDIIEKVVERIRNDRNLLEELEVGYLKTETIYNTKNLDVPEQISRTVWHMWYENGESLQQKIEQDGVAIIHAPIESPGPDALTRLPDLYDYAWADPPIAHPFSEHVPHYVIEFRPKNEPPKPKTQTEQGLVRMTGTMYIDMDHLFIAQMTASLPESFRKFLAWKVNSVDAEFSEGSFGGFWVLDRVTVKVNFASFGYETHNTYVYRYEYAPPGKYQRPPAR
jgi:hypothetical protein